MKNRWYIFISWPRICFYLYKFSYPSFNCTTNIKIWGSFNHKNPQYLTSNIPSITILTEPQIPYNYSHDHSKDHPSYTIQRSLLTSGRGAAMSRNHYLVMGSYYVYFWCLIVVITWLTIRLLFPWLCDMSIVVEVKDMIIGLLCNLLFTMDISIIIRLWLFIWLSIRIFGFIFHLESYNH